MRNFKVSQKPKDALSARFPMNPPDARRQSAQRIHRQHVPHHIRIPTRLGSAIAFAITVVPTITSTTD